MEQTVRARAVIFDMDGTLVDSNAVVEAIWTRFAERYGLVVIQDGVQDHSDNFTRFVLVRRRARAPFRRSSQHPNSRLVLPVQVVDGAPCNEMIRY